MSELDELRLRLDEIDGDLVELIAKRMQTVAEVREVKRRSGTHLFDRGREKAVLERALERGGKAGVPAELVRAVFGALFEASHDLQSDETMAETAAAKRVLIVGGHGKMGRRLSELLTLRGHTIAVLEKGEPIETDAVAAADVVMVAVPMTDAAAVAGKLAPLVRSDALLCDINSLKTDVCAAMQSCAGEVLGTHPMFGPTVSSLRRQKVVLCEVKPGPLTRWFEGELAAMGAEVIRTDAATHDRMMAIVQVLTHFGIMTMGRALTASGVSLADTLSFMSPIYRLEIAMVGRLFSQNAELYGEILMTNPEGARLRRLYVEQARALAELADQGDRDAFAAAFRQTAAFFEDFSAEAMDLSDQIIDTLMSRP